MKNLFNWAILLMIAIFTVTACSKNDDPVDNDIFVGRYNGTISYTKGTSESIRKDEGTVTVVKVSGDTYNFNFSDGIPSIRNVKMKKGESSTIILENGALGTVSISASKLNLTYAESGQTWVADCSR